MNTILLCIYKDGRDVPGYPYECDSLGEACDLAFDAAWDLLEAEEANGNIDEHQRSGLYDDLVNLLDDFADSASYLTRPTDVRWDYKSYTIQILTH
jgi:hypothetical protein